MKSFDEWVDGMSTDGWNDDEPTSIEKAVDAFESMKLYPTKDDDTLFKPKIEGEPLPNYWQDEKTTGLSEEALRQAIEEIKSLPDAIGASKLPTGSKFSDVIIKQICLNGQSLGTLEGADGRLKYIPSQQIKDEIIKEYKRGLLTYILNDDKSCFNGLIAKILNISLEDCVIGPRSFEDLIEKWLEENQ